MLGDFKSEIKVFLLVALIAVVVSVAGILLLRGLSPTPAAPTPSPTPTAKQISPSQQLPSPVPQPSPIPNETAGWKTYKDTSLDIEFKYPNDWKVEKFYENYGSIEGPDFSRPPADLLIPSDNGGLHEGTAVDFFLSFEDHNPEGPLMDYFKDLTEKVVSMGVAPNDNISLVYIGGKEAIKWDTHNQGSFPPGKDFVSTRYYVLHKGKFFQILKDYNLGKYEVIFNQILSTFRFVE